MGIFSETRRAKSQCSVTTLIAEGCNINGQFKVENNMQVDGCVEGQIYVNKTMVISESGTANGELYAEHIIVNGVFEGTCYAAKIEILDKGRVSGTLYTDNLSIEKGGRFNGITHPAPEKQVIDFKDVHLSEDEPLSASLLLKENGTSE